MKYKFIIMDMKMACKIKRKEDISGLKAWIMKEKQ